jgi:hypothetical protein
MATPRENRTAGLRAQRQNDGAGQGRRRAGADDGEVTVASLRRQGALSAVGSGNVETAPGNDVLPHGSRHASRFADAMDRFGGPAGRE